MRVCLGIIFCPDCGYPLAIGDFHLDDTEPELYVAECPVCRLAVQARRNKHGEIVAEPLRPA